jgi:hypothetical protein
MNAAQRLSMAASLLCLTGCQLNHQLKKACEQDACGPQEYHIKAPPQKIVIHRDDGAPPEAPCADDKPTPSPVEAQGRPTPVEAQGGPGQRQPTPMQAMGQQAAPGMFAQQGFAAPTAASGFAMVPTLPTGTALTLTFDVIRIPIPIPRLRTVDVPPESRISYVQIPAGAATAVAPMAVAPIAQAAAFAPQAMEPQQCITPQQVAAAAALVQARMAAQAGSTGVGSSSVGAASQSDIERVERQLQQLEALERKLDEAAAKQSGQSQSNSGWQKSTQK